MAVPFGFSDTRWQVWFHWCFNPTNPFLNRVDDVQGLTVTIKRAYSSISVFMPLFDTAFAVFVVNYLFWHVCEISLCPYRNMAYLFIGKFVHWTKIQTGPHSPWWWSVQAFRVFSPGSCLSFETFVAFGAGVWQDLFCFVIRLQSSFQVSGSGLSVRNHVVLWYLWWNWCSTN